MSDKKSPKRVQDKDKKPVSKKLWNGIRNVGMIVAIPINFVYHFIYHFIKFVFSKDFWRD